MKLFNEILFMYILHSERVIIIDYFEFKYNNNKLGVPNIAMQINIFFRESKYYASGP